MLLFVKSSNTSRYSTICSGAFLDFLICICCFLVFFPFGEGQQGVSTEADWYSIGAAIMNEPNFSAFLHISI